MQQLRSVLEETNTLRGSVSKMTANVISEDGEGLTTATWWMVDRSCEPRLKVGATPLVERCMRAHGWTEAFTMRVLNGYKIFLLLKQTFQDWDAKKLSPSIPIDRMWHQHILDTANYAKDCELLCGRMIHHDPDGGVDAEARNKRIQNTKCALRLKFDEDACDDEVWIFETTAGVSTGTGAAGRLSEQTDDSNATRGTKRSLSPSRSTSSLHTVTPPMMARSRPVSAGSVASDGTGHEPEQHASSSSTTPSAAGTTGVHFVM